MNKTQIRLMLDKQGFKVSTVRIGDVAVSLGLGDNVERSYADNEVKQIMDTIRQSQQQQAEAKEQRVRSDRHTQTVNTAHQKTVQDKAVLANRTQNQLSQVDAALTKIATDRHQAIEQVSDTLAYLYSPQTFQAEVLSRTAEKLGMDQSPQEPAPPVLTLDSLSDCFSRFADSVEYPAIAPSALGCLPM